MESFGDDVLGLVLRRVSNGCVRKSCSEVCKQWSRVEALTRASLRVLEPHSLRSFLPRFPNLTTLESSRRISDSDLLFIVFSCPDLQTLNLNLHPTELTLEEGEEEASELSDITDAGLLSLAMGCRNLRKITLRRRKGIGQGGVSALAEFCHQLSVLDLAWCSAIDDLAVKAIGATKAPLKVLCLRGSILLTDSGLGFLSSGLLARELKKLDLSQCDQITDKGVCLLHRMSCLEELNLAECGPRVTDTGGLAISSIGSLRRLDLSWLINLTDATVVLVAQNCRNLMEVCFTGCELITGAGILSFSNHPSLEILVLTSLSRVGAGDVEQTVLACRSLRYVRLDASLMGWMAASVREKLGRICRIDWI